MKTKREEREELRRAACSAHIDRKNRALSFGIIRDGQPPETARRAETTATTAPPAFIAIICNNRNGTTRPPPLFSVEKGPGGRTWTQALFPAQLFLYCFGCIPIAIRGIADWVVMAGRVRPRRVSKRCWRGGYYGSERGKEEVMVVAGRIDRRRWSSLSEPGIDEDQQLPQGEGRRS